MNRQDVDFFSAGIRCAAWLYLPERKQDAPSPPLVIMAHGMGAERTFRLPAFAEHFVNEGLAVLLFDYRNFGDSDGKPRNLIDPKRHLQDWEAALRHAHTLSGFDRDRIALWGTSFSGGHVLVTAANHPEVKCVVSQVPFVDGLARGASFTVGHSVRLLAHGLIDQLGSLVGRPPHQIRLAGDGDGHDKRGGFAMLDDPDGAANFERMLPPGSTWQNRVPARFVLGLSAYRPCKVADQIRCPVMLIAASKDSLVPFDAVEKTAQKIPQCEFVSRPVTHYEPYLDKEFEEVVAIEAEFLRRHLD
jgi:uncharacterized protein